MKRPEHRTLCFWQKVTLDIGFKTTFDLVPEQKIRNDGMSDVMFDAIVEAVKKSGCEYKLYTVSKHIIEQRPIPE